VKEEGDWRACGEVSLHVRKRNGEVLLILVGLPFNACSCGGKE
jgi:hypothetical protein